MKKNHLLTIRRMIGMIVSLGFLLACQPEDTLPETEPVPLTKTDYFGTNEPMLVLGKRKENPYSVENMRKALESLRSKNRINSDFDIQTTDLYVRFNPVDSTELDLLKTDTTLILWDYPLDFEVEVIGHYYHDPTLPDSVPTYQYTTVKPGYETVLPYEILAELFLPVEYEEESDGRVSNAFLEELEYESLRLTGNLDEEEESGGRVMAGKWTPSGTVRVREVVGTTPAVDNAGNAVYLPVVNVKVKAKGWFYLSKTYTDTQGRYSLKRTKRKVDYKIEFESDRVKVTNFMGWSRNHNGPNNRTSAWNPVFEWWGESWANATVLNAAYECRVQVNRRGMQTPFPTTFWAGSGRALNKLNIRIKYDEGSGRMISKPLTINEIKIWSDRENGDHRGTDFLYRVTFHELGHSMHARLNGSIAHTSKIIRESWADFIEHYFILDYYPAQASITGKQGEVRSRWTDGYSPLFIDLMDTDNQFASLGGDRPDDRVENYTFLQLQESLVKNNKLREVRDHLKANYTNSTRGNLDDLFDFYIDLE